MKSETVYKGYTRKKKKKNSGGDASNFTFRILLARRGNLKKFMIYGRVRHKNRNDIKDNNNSDNDDKNK